MKISFQDHQFTVTSSSGKSRSFDFPAVAVSICGRRIEAGTPAGPVRQLPDGAFQAEFIDEDCKFTVTITPGTSNCFFKQVEVVSGKDLPTPDYLEVDHQKQSVPGLKECGYKCSVSRNPGRQSDEEGHGIVPGCGYPLMGTDFFTGLEHPAAFNTIVSQDDNSTEWQLRHFPVWKEKKITGVRAVTGLSDKPKEDFFNYLSTIRLPVLKTPLVAFCTFWSDPYAGNLEYKVTETSYSSLLDAFNKLDLHPDIFTLDAGWQERNSILRAKESYGGEKSLIAFGEKLRASGIDFSLWVSPNGAIGIAPDYLRSQGISVGSGVSSHYSGDNYGVMLDEKLKNELTVRALELASPPYEVCHFKVDWDNECATSPEFDKTYPTRDHVREAVINIMADINRALREKNPKTMTRNGRWPSPWHLPLSSHLSLPDGGDCEYADFPALNQRDSSTNHRDLMYWCVFVRDHSVFPLDVLDNHEFSHSLRNPFQESPGVWSNTCIWLIMRGTSYHQLTLMPESLEDWQVKILKRTLQVLRSHSSMLITDRSFMTGDNPVQGGIYGFTHPGKDGNALIGLRNSSPLPQEHQLAEDHAFYIQLYPCCQKFRAGEKIVFAPHEVKVLYGCSDVPEKELPSPCQLMPLEDNSYACYLPASVRTDVREIHQIPELKIIHQKEQHEENRSVFSFGLQVPWRMRNFKLLFKITGINQEKIKPVLYTSRFASCNASSYAVPVAEIPYGKPGSGEEKNPDAFPLHDARYFAAALPQGGEVFCKLITEGAAINAEDLELWVSGYEAPARAPEETQVKFEKEYCLPLPHPDGFPRNIRLW